MRGGWRADREKVQAAATAAGRIALQSLRQAGSTSEQFVRLTKVADERIRNLQVGNQTIACKRGCHDCCYALVTCNWLEAQAIADHIHATFSPTEVSSLRERLAAYDAALAEDAPENSIRFRRACPLLEAGSCKIYDHRPFDCRGRTSWDADLCRVWKEQPSPNYAIASPNGEAMITAAMQREIASVLAPPSNTIVPLVRALSALMGLPPPKPAKNDFLKRLSPLRVKPDDGIARFEVARMQSPWWHARRYLEPWNPIRAVAGLFTPNCYRSTEEIDEAFASLGKELERLENADFRAIARDAYDALEVPRFIALAYSGRNVLLEMTRIGNLLEEKIAKVVAPDLLEPMPKRRPGRPRVAFVSYHLTNSNAANWSLGWLQGLDKGDFETFAIKIDRRVDAVTYRFRDAAENFLVLDGDPIEAARYLRSLDLDALIYPVLGDGGQNHYLAIFRLARRQATAWGCPATSGLPQIDDYLSGALTEPSDGQAQYRERLVTLAGNGLTYARMPSVLAHRGREDFELPAGHLVCVRQHLGKWLPEHDGLILEIASQLENPLHVAEFGSPFVVGTFKDRMERIGARLCYMPMTDVLTSLRVGGLFDLSLDAPDWHGGHSSFASLQYGTPVLSLLGNTLRSRMALGFQCQAGIPDAVVTSRSEYVARAISPEWTEVQRRRIDSTPLFDNPAPIRDIEAWIRQSATL